MRGAHSLILALVLASCGRAEYQAKYLLPGSDLSVSVALHQSGPFLAEYDRRLSVSDKAGAVVEAELFPDTGGYALVNIYRLPSGQVLIRTQGNHLYVLNPNAPSIAAQITTSLESRARPPDAEFLGAFDFDGSDRWRFIPGPERAEREIGKPHPQ